MTYLLNVCQPWTDILCIMLHGIRMKTSGNQNVLMYRKYMVLTFRLHTMTIDVFSSPKTIVRYKTNGSSLLMTAFISKSLTKMKWSKRLLQVGSHY